ncbi:recombinase family protein [Acidaminobacter sp.]|uniref:recombinase family protein n=1 Tax=Acidaminobacter sp. TaxID=1872102 RepID=UPI00256630B9|nr:recombinase family protein [Acidaminobacter sp.]MDK9711213.1 recombinase family protein [Acidaminobacter sp.]
MARKSRKTENAVVIETASHIRTVLYIRLSVEDMKGRGNSLDSQKNIMEQYIALKPDFKEYGVYIDNGATGTTFERPDFKRMLSDIEAGKIDCVMVKDLSRLGRNAIDTGYYIEKYFPLHNVRFISVNDNFDTDDKNSPSGGVILHLKNMINEAYAIDISRKIKAQAQQSMKAGDYIGARPPYGYDKAPDNCHKLIVDPVASEVVRQIFQWAYEKIGINDIVKRLNDANILPPSQYGQLKGRITHENLIGMGKWQTRTVAKILATDTYTGDMVQGKSKSVNHKQTPVPPENWITVRDTHKAIISREVFEAVKNYRENVSAEVIRRGKTSYAENIFKGKIFCACCGKSLHKQRCIRKKMPETYCYHCISNSRIAKGTCEGTLIYEDELRSLVMDILLKRIEVVTGKNLFIQKNELALKTRLDNAKSEISRLNQEIDKSRRYLRSLYENLVEGIITDGEYLDMKSAYEDKISAALNQSEDYDKEQAELLTQIERCSAFGESISGLSVNTELTAELVGKLINRITVDKSRNVEIEFAFESGMEMLDEMGAVING